MRASSGCSRVCTRSIEVGVLLPALAGTGCRCRHRHRYRNWHRNRYLYRSLLCERLLLPPFDARLLLPARDAVHSVSRITGRRLLLLRADREILSCRLPWRCIGARTIRDPWGETGGSPGLLNSRGWSPLVQIAHADLLRRQRSQHHARSLLPMRIHSHDPVFFLLSAREPANMLFWST